MNPFERLPSELIVSILEYLDNDDRATCTYINKSFHKQANPIYWQQLTTSNRSSELFSHLVHLITSSSSTSVGQHIRQMYLDETLTEDTILAFLQKVPFLTKLHIHQIEPITNIDLQSFPKYCPDLKDLRISIGWFSPRAKPTVPNSIAQRFTTALKHHCHQLTHIHLYQCLSLSGADLMSALSTCPLERICLDHCDFKDMYDPAMVEMAAFDLAQCGTTLKSLEVKDDSGSIDYTPFLTTQEGCAWPHLNYVSISPCTTLDDEKAIPFIQSHVHLQKCKLYSGQITDTTLDAMVMYLKHVTHISLSQKGGLLTPDGVRRLVKNISSTFVQVEIRGCGLLLSDFPDALRCCMTIDYDIYVGFEEEIIDDHVVDIYKGAFHATNSHDDDIRFCDYCHFEHQYILSFFNN